MSNKEPRKRYWLISARGDREEVNESQYREAKKKADEASHALHLKINYGGDAFVHPLGARRGEVIQE